MMHEVMIFLPAAGSDPQDLTFLEQAGGQQLGDRLFITSVDVLQRLQSAVVLKDAADLALWRAQMTDIEAAFAGSWLGKQAKPEQPGDGQPWDTPGFDAP